MTADPQQLDASRWPHRFAVLLVAATVTLIFVGGLVTTTESGMAVPDWPTTFGYGMFSFPLEDWVGGGWELFIEHGHRLLGSIVGLITIAFLLSLIRCDRRRWMWGLGLLALAAVIFQGILGGTRVIENERTLAMVHGCFAPIFLSLCVCNAVFTSRRWHLSFANADKRVVKDQIDRKPNQASAPPVNPFAGAKSGAFLFAAAVLVFAAYAQIVLGAQLRHLPATASAATGLTFAIFHVVAAVVLVIFAIAISLAARRMFKAADLSAQQDKSLNTGVRQLAHWLNLLICGQVALGCATWVLNYGWPNWLVTEQTSIVVAQNFWQTVITTGHQTTGSLILAACVGVFWRSYAVSRSAEYARLIGETNQKAGLRTPRTSNQTVSGALAGGVS